jgi:thymidylate kinase
MLINKIIAVEGLDKTGKSTFCNAFESVYSTMNGINTQSLKKYSFPNVTSPIGNTIRTELSTTNPSSDIVSTPNFLSEMSHYWSIELFNNTKDTATPITNNQIIPDQNLNEVNYLFDRYFISTIAYQAFFNNSKIDLEFIKTSLNVNKFLKIPTDIIFFDLPNKEILKRTLIDQEAGLYDGNDTLDESILDRRREAYQNSISFLKGMGINIHYIDDSSANSMEDLARILIGRIFT